MCMKVVFLSPMKQAGRSMKQAGRSVTLSINTPSQLLTFCHFCIYIYIFIYIYISAVSYAYFRLTDKNALQ